MRLWSRAHSSFGVAVMMAKLRIHSPAGDFQFSHRPANAIRPPVAERDRVRLLSGRGLRPFIKVIDRHEATPQSGRTAGVSENRQSGEIRTSVPARKSCSVPSASHRGWMLLVWSRSHSRAT